LLSTIANILAHSEREIGRSIITESMTILRLTENDKIQTSALARKIRVKIMQWIGILEIPRVRTDKIDISEILEEVIDFLLSSLSDKVFPCLID
jgi:hypothetical protein